ncbi:MAG: phosphoenolpyruvate--protein phosphotransferase [Brevinematia bacterium]
MVRLKGISVSKGIAIGKAFVIEPITFDIQIEKISPEQVKSEVNIFNLALEEEKKDINNLYSDNKHHDLKLLFINLLEENEKKILNTIANEKVSARSAVLKFISFIEPILKSNPLVAERAYDVLSVFYRLIQKIDKLKSQSVKKFEPVVEKELLEVEDYVIVGVEIDPTYLLDLLQKINNVRGIVLEKGGSASHASIIAHQNGIPAVFAVKGLLSNIKENDLILLNANEGEVVINPDDNTLLKFRSEKIKYDNYVEDLSERILELPTQTIDGKKCKIMLNISDPYEIATENTRYYDGVGLFRTELAFLSKGRFLTEEEQYELYLKVVEKFSNKPVIIRLLDLGGDKVFGKAINESKPALGWRSIRILFDKKEELMAQLRAIIRSNKYGNVKILIPMVSSLEEVRKIKEYFKIAAEDLKSKGLIINDNIEIGIMVEIPSVAVMIKEFLEEVDFISIGTNDLTQYTLAVDRNNEVIAEYYEPLNPAVLKLIYHCIHIANKEGKFVSVCGEIAGDYNYTRLLLAMGLRVFSMPQESVKFVKNVIVNTHTAELKKLLDSVKRALTPSEVKEIMEKDLEDFISRIGEPLKYAKRGK